MVWLLQNPTPDCIGGVVIFILIGEIVQYSTPVITVLETLVQYSA